MTGSTLGTDILDTLADHIAVVDPGGAIVAVNRAWQHFAQHNGGDAQAYLHENYLEICRRAIDAGGLLAAESYQGLRSVLEGERQDFRLEYPCHAPDEPRWFLMQVKPLEGENAGAVITHTDITQRKLAEAALKSSERNMKAIFDSISTAFFLVDRDFSIQFFNKAALAMARRFQDKMLELGTPFLAYVLPVAKEAAREALQRAREGEIIKRETFVSETWLEANYRPIFEADRVTGICLSYRDITARKQAEQALVASEAQLSRVFHHSPAAKLIISLEDHRAVDVNAAFLDLLAYKRGELIGRELKHLARLPDPALLEKQASDPQATPFEQRVKTATGAWRTVIMAVASIGYMQRPCLLITCIDISEHKRTEEQLLRAVQEVMKDATWFGRSLLEKLAETRLVAPQDEVPELTERERQVLSLMATGLANKDIAEALGISHQTVRNYVTRIYDKLELHSRAEAVVWARRHGLISL